MIKKEKEKIKLKKIRDLELLKISSFEKFPSEKITLNRKRITIK